MKYRGVVRLNGYQHPHIDFVFEVGDEDISGLNSDRREEILNRAFEQGVFDEIDAYYEPLPDEEQDE